MLRGIDISNWQEDLNLENVDFDFCIVKATDGTRFVDKTLHSFIARIRAMGKPFGFYHFANNPERGGTAIEQARYFVDVCKEYFGYGIPVLDWEDSDWKYGGPVLDLGPRFALEWLREVYRLTGIKPWIYTSKSVCNSWDWSQVANEGYALWGAQYATNDTLPGYDSDPWQDSDPWGAWGYSIPIFQYGSGWADGANMPVDLDLFYGDTSAWSMYCHSDSDLPVYSGVSAEDVLNVARSYIGCNEDDGSFRKIIDLYNTINPLPVNYVLKYSDEWCDGFVSAVAWQAGAYDLIGAECGVERHVELFKRMGIWNEDGSIIPNAGDVIVFNWDDSTQPNDGDSDHIGYVEKVESGQIVCIEGNMHECVGRRYIEIAWGYIRGFAQPKYSSGGNPQPIEPKNNRDGGKLDVDGYAGWNTVTDMQHALGTYEDGVISGQSSNLEQYTWAVVAKEFGYGGSQMVRALQRLVGASEDGYWGSETSTQLQRYLVSKGYQVVVDGYFGTESVSALQRCINDGKFGT